MKKSILRRQKARIVDRKELQAISINKWLLNVAGKNKEVVLENFNTSLNGLDELQVIKLREEWGDNKITHEQKSSLVKRFAEAFINPFTIVLFVLATISFFTDIILAGQGLSLIHI